MSENNNIIIMTAIVGLILFLAGGTLSQLDRIDAKGENPIMFADQQDPGLDQASATQVPKIYFPENEHDFGKVSQQSSLSHIFKVRNTGTAPLKIIQAKGS
jgi:hypothetical protein